MGVERARGTRDFVPEEAGERFFLENAVSGVFESFGYESVVTPLFEHAELFERKSGEEISEHMYVFEDKGGRRLCLRPEATASVARMFASELKNRRMPLRLSYFGRMFRYERPQKGRYREFWQSGVELIGIESAIADVEVIEVAARVLERVGLDYSLDVGHLGVLRSLLGDLGLDESRQDHIISLVDRGLLDDVRKEVSDERLFSLMSLSGSSGVLDDARKLLEGCSSALDALSGLRRVAGLLDVVGVPYKLNLGLGRGLSYYTGVVFEIRVSGLGAENQVCGGGRYDNLIGLFGGGSVPAVGFAFGFDRLFEAAKAQGVLFDKMPAPVVVAALSEGVVGRALEAASLLREGGFRVEFELEGRRLKKVLSNASEDNVEWVVLVGDREASSGVFAVKNMVSGKQEDVGLASLVDFLSK